MTDTEEPGYGRYKDKDKDLEGFWVHGKEGWTWYAFDGDPNPGSAQTWEDVRVYGPMTPMDEAPAADPLNPLSNRWSALDFASRCNPIDATQLINYARVVEAYLNEK